MGTLKKYFLLIILLLGGSIMASCAQQAETAVANANDVVLQITQVDTSEFPLVHVYVSARDGAGNSIPVPVTDIELLENGSPVQDTAIQGMDEVSSFTSLLLIDNSGSMNFSEKLTSAKEAASAYIDQMRPADAAGIISFNTRVETIQEITTDEEALKSGLMNIQARDDTAMWDALMTSIEMLNPLGGRKAIILLTDGMDNQSITDPNSLLTAIGESGLSISTIGFGTKPEGDTTPDEYEGIDETTLRDLAQDAGGMYGYAEDPETLMSLYNSIRQSLQSEVVISYITPQTLRDGVKRSLSVHLSGAWQTRVSGSSSSYNPGGLIPEVPEPGNWNIFVVLFVILLIILVVPLLLYRSKTKKKKKRIRIVLKD